MNLSVDDSLLVKLKRRIRMPSQARDFGASSSSVSTSNNSLQEGQQQRHDDDENDQTPQDEGEEDGNLGEGGSDPREFSNDGTQTDDGDTVDGTPLVLQPHSLVVQTSSCGNGRYHDEMVNGDHEGGWWNIFTLVLPNKRRNSIENSSSRTIGTQTEEQDPVCARGQQLSIMLIQELALQNPVPASCKDDVYESLASCICDMLVKHSILFNGMVRRCQVTHYHIFSCIANELFEANGTGHFNITWGRIISLFAFAVRLAQEYKEDKDDVECIIQFLASYVTKHLVPFVKSHDGWANLVEHYPAPVDEDAQIKRALLWSGLCVGLMATMYVSSFLSSR